MKPYALLLLCAPVYSQPQYTLVDLGQVTARGINNLGDVAGQRNGHAFLYKTVSQTFTDLGTLGGSTSDAYTVNDCRVVAGRSFISGDQAYHAFFYQAGRMTDLRMLPNESSAQVMSINNNRVMVGFVIESGVEHAVVFGPINDLGPGEAVSVNASANIGGQGAGGFIVEDGYSTVVPLRVTAINDFADAVGDITIAGATHAAFYHEGQLTDLGNLANQPAWNSHARGINDAGEIVGQSDALPPGTNQGVQRAFLYQKGLMTDLTSLIAPSDSLAAYVTLLEAVAINDSGWIAANGIDSRDGSHGYLLKRSSPAVQWKRSVGGCP